MVKDRDAPSLREYSMPTLMLNAENGEVDVEIILPCPRVGDKRLASSKKLFRCMCLCI